MSEKVSLPHHMIVSRWKEGKVIKWLKKVHLDDCIPAFEIRHIDGPKLLELTEQKLFTYQDLKIKHRKQIAKCVQECKSQASNAKRVAKTLKHKHGSHSHAVESNGTCDSGEDSDDWGSDFEDDSEDEGKDDQSVSEVNNNSIIQAVPATPDKDSVSYPVLQFASLEEKNIPKPPDIPVIPKSINGPSCFKNTSSIPRPPSKRPPSQPPPPPVPQATSHSDPQEDYEIPIVSTSISLKDSYCFSDSTFQSSTCSESSGIETYEIVEPPEENYEIVDPPASTLNMTEKPLLPPRHLKAPSSIPPPPLPQKPHKLKDGVTLNERPDGVRTFSRPRLPIKTESDVQTEVPQSTLPTNVGFIISSLIGRRSSTTPTSSPKAKHRNDSFSASSPPSAFLNDSLSSSSSSPDKDGFISDVKKMQPLPPLPPRGALPVPDEMVQNMATRPLPPVPVIKEEDNSNNNKQQDILSCPWFHEIEREDAEATVKSLNEAGAFVVRPSKRAGKENPFSLTVLHEDKLFHLNIRIRSDNTFALGKEKEKEKSFSTVAELITYHLAEPILLKNRGEPVGKTILRKYPEKT